MSVSHSCCLSERLYCYHSVQEGINLAPSISISFHNSTTLLTRRSRVPGPLSHDKSGLSDFHKCDKKTDVVVPSLAVVSCFCRVDKYVLHFGPPPVDTDNCSDHRQKRTSGHEGVKDSTV